ncbi:MAG TPA: HRDC domain-containing protein [Solirubrobacteraceae bacterium]|nr:HRDC domain-containing protein [Solirubrobacteraceae bacterium]
MDTASAHRAGAPAHRASAPAHRAGGPAHRAGGPAHLAGGPADRGGALARSATAQAPRAGGAAHPASAPAHPAALLADPEAIERVVAAARAAGRLGIDTEFMSEGRYRALLCLVQVVVDPTRPGAEPSILLIDTLSDIDVGPLAALLADPAIEVVLHAGRQDVAILRRAWRTEVVNIFDTQIAAGFAGASAQAGYGNLLGWALGERVGKTASYTRWDARPLTAEQLDYAAEDVAHLLALADEIKRRLCADGRLEWAREECRRLESATDERDPDSAWERLPRVSALDGRSRAVARELAAWRERTASRLDRPVGSIVADPALVELARRRPLTLAGLTQIRGLHPPAIKRRGEEILAAIQRGLQAPPIPREEARGRSEPADAPLISLAEALLRGRALDAGLAYELIASRAELEQIVAAARRGEPEPDVRTLSGWRRALVGDDLRDLLSGKAAVSVGAERRLTLVRTQRPAPSGA